MSQIFFNTIDNDQYDFMTEWNTAVMDKWVAENIGLSRCKDEAELFEAKWFDYRDMHPLMATWGRLREGAESYAKALASDILR